MNIDLHNHVVPPTIVDAITRNPNRYGTKIEVKDGKRYFTVHGPLAELKPVFYDTDAKVEWMDQVGLDVAGISVGPPIRAYPVVTPNNFTPHFGGEFAPQVSLWFGLGRPKKV